MSDLLALIHNGLSLHLVQTSLGHVMPPDMLPALPAAVDERLGSVNK